MFALDTAHGVVRVHLRTRVSRVLGCAVSAWATRDVLVDAGFPHRGVVERPVSLLRGKANWLEETVHEVGRLAGAGLDASTIRTGVLDREPLVAFGSLGEYGKPNLVRAALGEPW